MMGTDVIFGGDLQAQFQRAGHCVPPFVLNCIETVERRGLDSVGIYRLSGNASGIQKIKQIVNDRNRFFFFCHETQARSSRRKAKKKILNPFVRLSCRCRRRLDRFRCRRSVYRHQYRHRQSQTIFPRINGPDDDV